MLVRDQLSNVLEIPGQPRRIVCLVPSLTELLVDLGLKKSIVGITKFCIHPKGLTKEKTLVGGTKHVKFGRLRELKPDFILCNKEENTLDIVQKCQKIAPTYVSDIYNIEHTKEVIHTLGEIFSCEKKAQQLIVAIQDKQNDFLQFIQLQPKYKVAYFIWKNPWMVAANNTFINYLLQLNGFENTFEDLHRYPEISVDDIKKRINLDCIFLSSEPYPFKKKDIDELQKTTKSKIFLVDGAYFSWYGSRLIKAFDYFKSLRLKLTD